MPTTAQLLAEARAAYHALMTGQQVVEVRDSTGESVRYALSNRGALRAYIAELEALVGGTTNAAARVPMRPIFG